MQPIATSPAATALAELAYSWDINKVSIGTQSLRSGVTVLSERYRTHLSSLLIVLYSSTIWLSLRC